MGKVTKYKIRYRLAGEPNRWVRVEAGLSSLVENESEAFVFDNMEAARKWVCYHTGLALRPAEWVVDFIPV